MFTEGSTPVTFLYTADVDRCVGWYRDVLGAGLRDRDDHGAFLDSAGALLRVTALPNFKPTEHPVAGWEVTDLAAAALELREKGVTFTVYDGMGQDEQGIWNGPDGSRLAWFSDPDGNVLMLNQQGSAGQ
jgi:catechol 2,3-dioxygenase-like lactoylglutathione lyase family enzyme